MKTVIALAILVAMQIAPCAAFDRQATESKCHSEWGNLRLFVQRCVDYQEQYSKMLRIASEGVEALLQDVVDDSDKKEVRLHCTWGFSEGTQLACVHRVLEQAALLRAGAWPRPDDVPEEVFATIKEGCKKAGNYYEATHCIDFSLSNWRSWNK